MTNRGWLIVGGVGVGVLTLFFLPWWATLLLIAIVVGVPIAAYRMLDPSQRRRLNSAYKRGKLKG
jgi:membrane protein implicated in regulation of membrane protease activity